MTGRASWAAKIQKSGIKCIGRRSCLSRPAGWHVLAQQISVHDPSFLIPRLRTHALNLIADLTQSARKQDLVRSPQVCAPIDFDIALVDRFERAVSIEQ